MKRTLSFLSALLLLGTSLSAVSGDEKTKKIKEENGPVSYVYEVLKRDQTIKHGTYQESTNGNTTVSGSYMHGKPSGTWAYFIKGEKYAEEAYENGQLNGEVKTWWEGKLTSKTNYQNGLKSGVKETYSLSTSQKLSSTNYVNGERNGIYESWFENGKQHVNASYAEGKLQGAYSVYYANGQLRCQFSYIDDQPQGTFLIYHSSGDTMISGQIADGKLVNAAQYSTGNEVDTEYGIENGTGMLKLYSSSNIAQSILQFKNGQLNGEQKVFWDNGQIASSIAYSEGIPNGAVKRFNENGVIKESGSSRNGYRIGEWQSKMDEDKPYSTDYELSDSSKFTDWSPTGVEAFKTTDKDASSPEFTEQAPEFPGEGTMGIAFFLRNSVVYPTKDKNEGTSGVAYVQFVVNDRGSVENVQIYRGKEDAATDEMKAEGIRVVESMPRWQPGFQKGMPVNCRFMLPIRFKLR